jgi:hypothetical protein
MASDIITPAFKWLFEIGFGNVFVFILATAIFYAVFKKSKILGESDVISGSIAIVAAFLISFWIPIYTGFSFVSSLSAFFAQATALLLFLTISFLMASFFYPDLMGMLTRLFESRHTLFVMMGLGIALLVTSTLVTSFWSVFPPATAGSITPSTDILIIVAAVIVFIVVLAIAASVGSVGG